MKRVITVALVCLVAAVVLLVLFKTLQTVPPPAPGETVNPVAPGHKAEPAVANRFPAVSTNRRVVGGQENNPALAGAAATTAGSLAANAGERVADTNASLNLPPDIRLQNVRRVVRQYGDMFGGNPVGTNPEITAALSGNNPKQINFLNGQPGLRVNGNGELVDAWDTPYFFHQLSAAEMEIHSAGPDKTMWTRDDLVTK